MKLRWHIAACLLACFVIFTHAGCQESGELPQQTSPDAPVDDLMTGDEVPPQ